jgi:hypothetical protein
MKAGPTTVEEWKRIHSKDIIECRWGCRMTKQACGTYQLRTQRYVIHFGGHDAPLTRPNAEYVRCFYPTPCPHLLLEARQDDPGLGVEMEEIQEDEESRLDLETNLAAVLPGSVHGLL